MTYIGCPKCEKDKGKNLTKERTGSLQQQKRRKQEKGEDRIQIRIEVISLVNCASGITANPAERKKESLPLMSYKLSRVLKAQNYCPRTNKFPKLIQKIVEPIL